MKDCSIVLTSFSWSVLLLVRLRKYCYPKLNFSFPFNLNFIRSTLLHASIIIFDVQPFFNQFAYLVNADH